MYKRPRSSSVSSEEDDFNETKNSKYMLSYNRFADVSRWKGRNYISIRQYFRDNLNRLWPMKKGISLREDEWEKL